VVSLFGMVNTLILSVFERTRELGMLRAVGMTRRQARRKVRHESVVTALIGAALGLPLATGMAALVTYALCDEELIFDLPIRALTAFAVIAIAVGVIAAVFPARRAARLDPLRGRATPRHADLLHSRRRRTRLRPPEESENHGRLR
jgi:putative ABC transport system permease protein